MKPFYTFSPLFILLTCALGFATLAILSTGALTEYRSFVWSSFGFVLVICWLSHYIISRGIRGDGIEQFLPYFTAGMGLKFMAAIIFALVYVTAFKPANKMAMLPFIGYYASYTCLLIVVVSKRLRKHSSKGAG